MNSYKATRILLLSLGLMGYVATTSLAHRQPVVTYQVFYRELSPYGQWISDEQFGYVWVPDVERGFRPYYTNGYWIMTNYGNTWYSDYPWGWAVFHYGRWTYNTYYGWVWVPGFEWAPAWICWRHGYGYYGWAPLYPGFTVTLSFAAFGCPADWWIFIPPVHLHDHHFHHYWHGPRNNTHFIRRTDIIGGVQSIDNNTQLFPTGPGREELKAEAGISVTLYQLSEASSPGQMALTTKNLSIYRPAIITGADGVAPERSIKTPHSIEAPAPIKTNDRHEPPFKTEYPIHVTPINKTEATDNGLEKPGRQAPLQSKTQDVPRINQETSPPGQRISDDVYRPKEWQRPDMKQENKQPPVYVRPGNDRAQPANKLPARSDNPPVKRPAEQRPTQQPNMQVPERVQPQQRATQQRRPG